MFFFLKLYHLHDYFSFNICIYHHKLNLFTPTLSFILLHACSFTESVCKNVLLIHDLASILSFGKISLCLFHKCSIIPVGDLDEDEPGYSAEQLWLRWLDDQWNLNFLELLVYAGKHQMEDGYSHRKDIKAE